MNDTQLTETFLNSEVVYPGVIIRLEHWHVKLPQRRNRPAGGGLPPRGLRHRGH